MRVMFDEGDSGQLLAELFQNDGTFEEGSVIGGTVRTSAAGTGSMQTFVSLRRRGARIVVTASQLATRRYKLALEVVDVNYPLNHLLGEALYDAEERAGLGSEGR